MPLGNSSPDHSIFSRFRSRLPKEVMDQINSDIIENNSEQDYLEADESAIRVRYIPVLRIKTPHRKRKNLGHPIRLAFKIQVRNTDVSFKDSSLRPPRCG